MRLDLFLKSSRLIPRRTLAQEFCDAGLIDVNGVPARSSKEVKPGDTIAIRRRNRRTEVRVESIPKTKQVSKGSAASLFTVLRDEGVVDDLLR
ncbi:MAG: S4 domain-containing protein [Pyrinomonadaceae bacterium]